MSNVRRVYVEKKAGYDVAAQGALTDFRENLFLEKLKNVRIILRYDSEGISDQDYESAIENVFSEPAVDKVYREELPLLEGEIVFGVEYLPGQYDQRADSAAQCVQLLLRKQRPQNQKVCHQPGGFQGGFYGKATFAGYAAFCARECAGGRGLFGHE